MFICGFRCKFLNPEVIVLIFTLNKLQKQQQQIALQRRQQCDIEYIYTNLCVLINSI